MRGSKNAVSKHMVAAMLGDAPSTIRNVPEVGDTDITAAMLESIGYHVVRSDAEITIVAGDAVEPRVPEAFTGLNRIPILMLGPLLHQAGEAYVPLVGGDPIGRRPVDYHVAALRALGAEVTVGPGGISARAPPALRGPHRPAVPQRGRDRDRAAVRRAGRGQDRAAQRGH